EGQFFVAGCNRVGTTGGSRFCGRSLIVGPGGSVMGRGSGRRQVVTGRLDPAHVAQLRKQFPMT
ncbi:MAG: nitrilase-related carbon-nitrogen hydrolase, partial [bacterium]|nr:nitrilase-related carbon-nitrogen hydrolase [bacterium]